MIRVAIIGAGFAGAATAYHLKKMGVSPVIFERESIPGFHASGRNAGLFRLLEMNPVRVDYAQASLQGIPKAYLNPTGGIYYGKEALSACEVLASRGIAFEVLTKAEAKKKVPFLKDHPGDQFVFVPSEGVVDIHALLMFYLSDVELRLRAPVEDLWIEENKVRGLVVEGEKIKAEKVVIAAGAWCGELYLRIHNKAMPLKVTHRHLFVTLPDLGMPKTMPFFWDLEKPYYFREENKGLLLCPGDEEEVPPGDYPPNPDALELLYDRLGALRAFIENMPILKGWTGLRVFAPEDLPFIAPDPEVEGLYWVAGLGGHGMTCSYIYGVKAAQMVMKGEQDPNLVFPRLTLSP